jgi:flagellin
VLEYVCWCNCWNNWSIYKNYGSKLVKKIDKAITTLNGYRGDIGSTQNQVESAVRNLMTQSTNIKAAESVIRDVDYAEESANFNKLNIISQAGSYAISQSNATQQNVLRLLQ